jgi:hypothetical protein
MGFWASIHWLLAHGPHPVMWAADNVGELIVTVCFLALTAVAWRSFDRATALYCAGFWLLVLTSPEWMNGYFSPLSSTDRFILALFPLAGWAPSRIPEARLRPLLVVSAVFLVGTAAYHATGGWVG